MCREGEPDVDARGKISMKELFGRRNIKKDGQEGKVGSGSGFGMWLWPWLGLGTSVCLCLG